MPKASKPRRMERLRANLGQTTDTGMQVPMGKGGMAVSLVTSTQQNLMPRHLMPSYPSATPVGGARTQYPAAAPPGYGLPLPPPAPSSTGSVRPQDSPGVKSELWSFVSGILTTDDKGNPLRTPDRVATTLHKYIYQPVNKMPQADAEKLIALRADIVIDWIMLMSSTWPFENATQYDPLNQLVALLLRYDCIKRETLGRAVSKAWLKFQLGNRPHYVQQLTGFVMQIHMVHWQLLSIPFMCWPLYPGVVPTWVDLLVPRDYCPPAQAELEARAKSAGVGLFFEAMSSTGSAPRSQNPPQNTSRRPSQNLSQNEAPTSVANLPTMQQPMPAQAPQQLDPQQPKTNPSQIPRTNTGTRKCRQRPNPNLNTNIAPR